MFSFHPGARIRPSPFFEAKVAEGLGTAKACNRTVMPTSCGAPEGEYGCLIDGVSQRDVGNKRQGWLKAPEVGRPAQAPSVRDLSTCKVCMGKVTHDGTRIGILADFACSSRMKAGIGFSLIDSCVPGGSRTTAARVDGPAQGRRVDIPFP